MVIHDTSHKPTLPQQLRRRFDRFAAALNARVPASTSLNNTFQRTFSPCRSITFLPNVGTECN